jgi:hypothetical protein
MISRLLQKSKEIYKNLLKGYSFNLWGSASRQKQTTVFRFYFSLNAVQIALLCGEKILYFF